MESKVKRYRLKKDLPTFKAGDIFRLEDTGSLWWHGRDNGRPETKSVVAYQNSTLYKFPNILTDWFEEILEKPKTVWHLKPGEIFWALTSVGEIFDHDDIDQYHAERAQGGIFLTKKDAQKELARRKAKVILERDTKGFRPDAIDLYKHWEVYYDAERGLAVAVYHGLSGVTSFATQEDAEASIKAHEKEWKAYLGVEE